MADEAQVCASARRLLVKTRSGSVTEAWVPLSLRTVEDLLHERGIGICHETVRFWWHRFGLMFAAEIRKRAVQGLRSGHWRWHLDEVFVKINGELHYLWRAVDHDGEVLQSSVMKRRDKKAALKTLKKTPKRHSLTDEIVTDLLRSYGAALREPSSAASRKPVTGRTTALNTRTNPSEDGSGRCSASGACGVCRNLSPFTPQCTIISTRSAPFTAGRISS
jgi:transposase-like protein